MPYAPLGLPAVTRQALSLPHSGPRQFIWSWPQPRARSSVRAIWWAASGDVTMAGLVPTFSTALTGATTVTALSFVSPAYLPSTYTTAYVMRALPALPALTTLVLPLAIVLSDCLMILYGTLRVLV